MEEKIWQKLIAKSILPLLIWQNRAAAAVEETQCCSTIESAVKSLFCPIRSRIRKIKDGHFIIVDDCCTWQVSLYCLDWLFLEDKLQLSSWSPWRKFALDCYLLVQSFSWHHRTPPTMESTIGLLLQWKNVIHTKISNKRSCTNAAPFGWSIGQTGMISNISDHLPILANETSVAQLTDFLDLARWSSWWTTSCLINSFIWFCCMISYFKINQHSCQKKSLAVKFSNGFIWISTWLWHQSLKTWAQHSQTSSSYHCKLKS